MVESIYMNQKARIPFLIMINPTALLVYQLVRIHVTMPLELMKV